MHASISDLSISLSGPIQARYISQRAQSSTKGGRITLPSRDAHIERADRNATFAQSFELETTPYLDWVVTGFFYSALHYIDACLHEHRTKRSPNGYNPTSHEDRTPLINKLFPSVYPPYRELKDASEDARYELKPFTAAEVRELQEQDWQAVRSFARSRLNL